MILLNVITQQAINPALKLLPARMDSDSARVMLLAIGQQESRFMHRVQVVAGGGEGPAVSYWQFERPGGVRGVIRHPLTRIHCANLCKQLGVAFDEFAVHKAMRTNDVLGAGMARLLLYSDSKPLPNMDAKPQEGWDAYERIWNPGKPHRETWDACWQQAKAQVLA